MAKQIAGLCFFEGTIDDLTFYQMDGQYYCRAKSCLTSERVKTSPRFKLTMLSARRMARASKIGAAIYKALPPRWRQFWMYRSFTGEAFILLKYTDLSEEAITAQLHACYVADWDARRAADPDNAFWLPVPVKVRKRRVYSAESLQRRWDAMRVKRPRREIREEKRLEEEARRQAWREKLAVRDAARAAALAATSLEQDHAGGQVQGLSCLKPAAIDAGERAPGLAGDLNCRDRAAAKASGADNAGKQADGLSGDVRCLKPAAVDSEAHKHWYIDQRGMLQKQSVPGVTRKRPTGTRTMFKVHHDMTNTCVTCDSS